jgi:hypothetical protein
MLHGSRPKPAAIAGVMYCEHRHVRAAEVATSDEKATIAAWCSPDLLRAFVHRIKRRLCIRIDWLSRSA